MTLSESDVLDRLRAFMSQHKNQRQAAKALGVTQQWLNDVLTGRRPSVGPTIMRGLGLEKYTVIRPIKKASAR